MHVCAIHLHVLNKLDDLMSVRLLVFLTSFQRLRLPGDFLLRRVHCICGHWSMSLSSFGTWLTYPTVKATLWVSPLV